MCADTTAEHERRGYGKMSSHCQRPVNMGSSRHRSPPAELRLGVASSHEKGNVGIEIAKRAGSMGAASGAILTRRKSQSSKFQPVKPQCRLQASLEKPARAAPRRGAPTFQSCRNQIDARIRVPLKKRIGQRKHENGKTQSCRRGAVARSPLLTCPRDPKSKQGGLGAGGAAGV